MDFYGIENLRTPEQRAIRDAAREFVDGEIPNVRGFIVPGDTMGYSAPVIESKMSLRASSRSEIVLQDCRVGPKSLLPEANGLRAPLGCLTQARYGISLGRSRSAGRG